ncbi:NUDIX hydrolase [Microvirga lenta]|uniref:NUDIX hydrolase n=1 Tax=Microvirga lenta TaxID=2881337 RepID=UPI001CFF5A76|nr:NUDIX hydrolase [Microvirga lenta]MCB5175206.1 NUDIX hydrolase [Microvirga lenta]
MSDNLLPPWQVTGSRYIHRDRWIRLRADDCVTADGVEVSPYYVLEYPDVVIVLGLTAEDKLILVRQYRHGLGLITTELPGGIIDKEDKNPLEAAARELAEETGYVSTNLSLVARLSPGAASRTNYFYVVLARDAEPLLPKHLDPAEAILVDLVDCEEAIRMCASGAIVQTHDVASIHLGLSAAGKLKQVLDL